MLEVIEKENPTKRNLVNIAYHFLYSIGSSIEGNWNPASIKELQKGYRSRKTIGSKMMMDAAYYQACEELGESFELIEEEKLEELTNRNNGKKEK